MSHKERYDRQLKALVDALGRSVVEAPDEEILEDARLAGVDLAANATELKEMFVSTAKSFQKRKLVQAQEDYAKAVESLKERSFQLPPSSEEQRSLLQLLVAQQAQKGVMLTAKFRDFENLSDNDVASLLEDLIALGLIPESDSQPEI
ncbi:MAG: hypothetical protein HY650_00365 [Acidobacteria bacterium]|nr:hypothetical protein [Acidobacteriota bacterium]